VIAAISYYGLQLDRFPEDPSTHHLVDSYGTQATVATPTTSTQSSPGSRPDPTRTRGELSTEPPCNQIVTW
jgi:hypothetical protein